MWAMGGGLRKRLQRSSDGNPPIKSGGAMPLSACITLHNIGFFYKVGRCYMHRGQPDLSTDDKVSICTAHVTLERCSDVPR
mmetsp:Transcript_20400/g.46309  ORF Transcript_20400/g.46309 Transcript_20400/m.46309 type:complete len:81 (+) Transcript_20400:139-381(+)